MSRGIRRSLDRMQKAIRIVFSTRLIKTPVAPVGPRDHREHADPDDADCDRRQDDDQPSSLAGGFGNREVRRATDLRRNISLEHGHRRNPRDDRASGEKDLSTATTSSKQGPGRPDTSRPLQTHCQPAAESDSSRLQNPGRGRRAIRSGAGSSLAVDLHLWECLLELLHPLNRNLGCGEEDLLEVAQLREMSRSASVTQSAQGLAARQRPDSGRADLVPAEIRVAQLTQVGGPRQLDRARVPKKFSSSFGDLTFLSCGDSA